MTPASLIFCGSRSSSYCDEDADPDADTDPDADPGAAAAGLPVPVEPPLPLEPPHAARRSAATSDGTARDLVLDRIGDSFVR